MSREYIPKLLLGMKKSHTYTITWHGGLFTAEELLSILLGRQVEYDEAIKFIS